MQNAIRPTLTGATVLLLAVSAAQAKVTLDLDYSYDTNGFFNPSTTNGQLARATLAKAADYYNDRFLDTLTAIVPSGQNTWTPDFPNPATGADATLDNPTIAANSIKVFAGGRSLTGTTLAIGGPGGYNASGFQPFFDTLDGRGQSGALLASPTDYGPWGGAITFDTDAATTWNYNSAAAPTGSQVDMLSVALHELGHLLGIGTSASFTQTYTSGLAFTGPKAKALNNGANVPLANSGHLSQSLTSTVTGTDTQTVVMAPAIGSGQRRLITRMDWAVFDDLGWDLAKPGDANASGNVNFDDLVVLAQNYNQSGPNISWSEGDFNYNGVVNFDDLVSLAQNYNTSGAQAIGDVASLGSSFAADWKLAEALVPEPTTFVTLLAGASFVVRRSRR